MNDINNNLISKEKYIITKVSPVVKKDYLNNKENPNKSKKENNTKSFSAFLEEEIKKIAKEEKGYCRQLKK